MRMAIMSAASAAEREPLVSCRGILSNDFSQYFANSVPSRKSDSKNPHEMVSGDDVEYGKGFHDNPPEVTTELPQSLRFGAGCIRPASKTQNPCV